MPIDSPNRRAVAALLIAVAAAVAACAPRPDVAADTASLLAADRAWAAAAAAGDADSVLSFWADDARVAMPGAPMVEGREAIRAMIAQSFAQPDFRIAWTPERAVVAASGDLGYTTGTNAITMADPTGAVTTSEGRYLTIWRRGDDGRWRNVEDYASPAPAPASAPVSAPAPQ